MSDHQKELADVHDADDRREDQDQVAVRSELDVELAALKRPAQVVEHVQAARLDRFTGEVASQIVSDCCRGGVAVAG